MVVWCHVHMCLRRRAVSPVTAPDPQPNMAWFADSDHRLAWVKRNGLPITIMEARVQADGFFAIYLTADEAVLPRSNAARGWELHITLGFRSDYPEGVAEIACGYFNAAWAGRFHVVDVEWIGHGGAAMIRRSDPLAEDPLINWVHRQGYYGTRQLHISL